MEKERPVKKSEVALALIMTILGVLAGVFLPWWSQILIVIACIWFAFWLRKNRDSFKLFNLFLAYASTHFIVAGIVSGNILYFFFTVVWPYVVKL